MKYATSYDVGDLKREQRGINEDSIAITVFQDGHREGYDPEVENEDHSESDAESEPDVHGPGDKIQESEANSGERDEEDAGVAVNEQATEIFSGDNGGEIAGDSGPEDRYAGIFVLADGAGGEDAGDIASYIATTVIAERLSGTVHRAQRLNSSGFDLAIDQDVIADPPDEAEIQEAITEATHAAHESIIEYATGAGLGGTYATVVVGVYYDCKLHYGWVGDSRIYVINNKHKELSLLTKDHAKVQQYEDQGKVDSVEAHVHPDGNEINRALGGSTGMDPASTAPVVETASIPLFQEDVVALMSDGIIDAQTDYHELYAEYIRSDRDEEVGRDVLDAVVTDEDIRDIVVEEPNLDAAADRFVDFSNEKGGKDNISVVLFSGSRLPTSPDPEQSPLPERAWDPDADLEDRETVIK